MADIDIKNIAFKYVKVSGGASTIDVIMDDARFYKNKPDGYYRCFIFPKKYFSGISYDDLHNLVLAEKDSMWNETNRDTFFGYCEQTNKFVCNINAYMGLKDTQLKTDGAIQYSGMACWYEMDITSTASDGILKLKQTDGTYTYLSIIQPVVDTVITNVNGVTTGNACIEIEEKTIANADIVEKQGAFWVKSPQDNSVLMTSYCLNSSMGSGVNSFQKGNRIVYNSYHLNAFYQLILYGKPVVHFMDSGANQKPITIVAESNTVYVKNNTGVDYVEYTETDDLNSILNSNESLNFLLRLKNKTTYGYYQAQNRIINGLEVINDVNSAIPPLKGELFSLDPKNKPVLYKPSITSFTVNSTEGYSYRVNSISNFIKNIPDGFIFIANIVDLTIDTWYIYRFKKGENIKYKPIAGSDSLEIINVIDAANRFGMEIFYENSAGVTPNPSSYYVDKYLQTQITKDDLINGVGFTDAPSNNACSISLGTVITVYKI